MLSGVKRLVWLAVLLLIGVSVLVLILQNPQQSQFRFLFWITPELPFSILLMLAFALGSVTALLLSLWLAGRRAFKSSGKSK
ncbi:lipopolysaccharide assembly protein LapA domain-containing protein [Pseudomonas subflava]|uniref:lipopolysaccharide assembly protein LapA domain-containing protein n=1 Tax=Pseudomonas subflava TaxID=2952933 RepID=UPI002079BE8D|nr:LapA family protein [Pseudomonas subflava]